MAWSAADPYGQLPPTGWTPVTTNVCMLEADGFEVELVELAPEVELVALVAELFSRTPVTRTRWLTYWLRFTVDPWGRSM